MYHRKGKYEFIQYGPQKAPPKKSSDVEEEEEKTFDNRAFCGDCYLFLPNMVRVGFFAVLLYHGLVLTGVEGEIIPRISVLSKWITAPVALSEE